MAGTVVNSGLHETLLPKPEETVNWKENFTVEPKAITAARPLGVMKIAAGVFLGNAFFSVCALIVRQLWITR